jgi:hypothetical protein
MGWKGSSPTPKKRPASSDAPRPLTRKQARYEERKAAAARAAEADEAAMKALHKKLNQKGGAGKLTREELKLARRMGEGQLLNTDSDD